MINDVENIIEKVKPLVKASAIDMKLLIAEDEESNREFYKIAFGQFFNVCDMVEDGQKAYDLWNKDHKYYDLVITDMQMPKMNGLDLVKKIREVSMDQSIIVITGITDIEANQGLAYYYIDGLLPKPINNNKLYILLYRVLQKISEKKELDFYIKNMESQLNESLDNLSHLQFIMNKLTPLKEQKEVAEVIALIKTLSNKQGISLHTQQTKVQETKKKVEISQESQKDLRMSTADQILSATDFTKQLDDGVIDKVESFLDILDEMVAKLYDMEEQSAEDALKSIQNIRSYINEFLIIVDLLVIFPIVSRAFINLNNFLALITSQDLEDVERKKLLVSLLLNVEKDLNKWIHTIFINREAQNIYYFDASFLNGMLEIESMFSNTGIDDDSIEEIEFF